MGCKPRSLLFPSCTLIELLAYTMQTVGGPSMYPTYPTNKGTAFADRRARLGHDLAIGDIVQFKHPNLPHSYGIKRVVGLPGDYVCRDPAFGVVVGEEGEMLRVPEGHMWVVGDNLGLSRDSRWFGAVPLGLVVGRSVAFYNEKTGFRRVRRGLQRVTEDP